MMIQWFEDKLNHAIPPTEESLARLTRYAQTYADCGQVAASLACVLCRLVVECSVKGASVYGALQAYTGEGTKVYYLPNLPLPRFEFQTDLKGFLEAEEERISIASFGHNVELTCPNPPCKAEPLVPTESVEIDEELFQCLVCGYKLGRQSKPLTIRVIGARLCAIFPLAKRLQVDPDKLLFVAIVAAELLFSKPEEEMQVPIQINIEQVEAMFGL